jgi:hypothetical protein
LELIGVVVQFEKIRVQGIVATNQKVQSRAITQFFDTPHSQRLKPVPVDFVSARLKPMP